MYYNFAIAKRRAGVEGLFTKEKGKNKESFTLLTGVAVSEDGKLFVRAAVNQSDIASHIVMERHCSHNLFPFFDTNPASLPSERYKAICGAMTGAGKRFTHKVWHGAVRTMTSRDGYTWKTKHASTTDFVDAPYTAVHAHFDSLNTVLWEPALKRYVLFSRANIYRKVGRSFQWSTSPDMKRWGPMRPCQIKYKGGAVGKHEQFYTNAVQKMPGSPHIYISLPARCFTDDFRKGCDAVLMTSRDFGQTWDRSSGFGSWLPMLDYIPFPKAGRPGKTFGPVPVAGMLETEGDTMTFFVQQFPWEEPCHIYRYTIPRGQLISLSPLDGGKPGILTTRKVFLDAKELHLNCDTGKDGAIEVQVMSEDGKLVPSYSFSDCDLSPCKGTSVHVSWQGKSLPPDLAVAMFMFKVTRASLFGLNLA